MQRNVQIVLEPTTPHTPYLAQFPADCVPAVVRQSGAILTRCSRVTIRGPQFWHRYFRKTVIMTLLQSTIYNKGCFDGHFLVESRFYNTHTSTLSTNCLSQWLSQCILSKLWSSSHQLPASRINGQFTTRRLAGWLLRLLPAILIWLLQKLVIAATCAAIYYWQISSHRHKIINTDNDEDCMNNELADLLCFGPTI